MNKYLDNIFIDDTPHNTIRVFVKRETVINNVDTLSTWLDRNSIWRGCDWKDNGSKHISWEFTVQNREKLQLIVDIFKKI